MAQKRMFAISVVESDLFTDMPTSAQALYFHLGMNGDDDGFVNSPNRIMRAVGCNNDDLKLLIAKGFLIPFDSGVIVIRHWAINNTLQNDRYHETIYQAEKNMLSVSDSKIYQLVSNMDTKCIRNVTQPNVTQPNVTQPNKTHINSAKSSNQQNSVDDADEMPW